MNYLLYQSVIDPAVQNKSIEFVQVKELRSNLNTVNSAAIEVIYIGHVSYHVAMMILFVL